MNFFVEGGTPFGVFIPFLQLAFGVNVLFGAWDRIYAHLEIAHNEAQEGDKTLLAKVDSGSERRKKLDRKYETCETVRKGFRWTCQRGGIAAAIIIAIAVLAIPPDQRISGWWIAAIGVSGFIIPILMWAMYRFGKKCHDNATSMAHELAKEAAAASDAVGRKAAEAAQGIGDG